MIVMKRDGREDQYTKTKIHTAISKAIAEVTNGAGDNSLPLSQIVSTQDIVKENVQFR